MGRHGGVLLFTYFSSQQDIVELDNQHTNFSITIIINIITITLPSNPIDNCTSLDIPLEILLLQKKKKMYVRYMQKKEVI